MTAPDRVALCKERERLLKALEGAAPKATLARDAARAKVRQAEEALLAAQQAEAAVLRDDPVSSLDHELRLVEGQLTRTAPDKPIAELASWLAERYSALQHKSPSLVWGYERPLGPGTTSHQRISGTSQPSLVRCGATILAAQRELADLVLVADPTARIAELRREVEAAEQRIAVEDVGPKPTLIDRVLNMAPLG